MKKIVITLLALILFIPVNSTNAATKEFTDVPNDFWAYEEIKYLTSKGVISGYQDGTFKPNNPVSRAQAVVMLARALDLPLDNRRNPFYDVSSNHWAVQEISAIAEEGIFPMFEKFEPDQPLTRELMSYSLTKAYYLPNFMSDLEFADVPYNNKYKENISAILSNRITVPYADNTFKPLGSVTRAQFSVFMARVLEPSFRKGEALNKELIYTLTDQDILEAIELGKSQESVNDLILNDQLILDRQTYEAFIPTVSLITPKSYASMITLEYLKNGEDVTLEKIRKDVKELYPTEYIYFFVQTYHEVGDQKEDSVFIVQDHLQREPEEMVKAATFNAPIGEGELAQEVVVNNYLVAFKSTNLDFDMEARMDIRIDDELNRRMNTFEYIINFAKYTE
ncbi:S-layer homology domain-containing protein [Bacillus salitolerans]|uniref:S-layer homology domain-containing protein n=1 Tax=Bacillus salitolerans TaxID=1437434 RepID=A0ABW4LIX6_9BACI